VKYPTVLDESATLDLVVAGASIARYGDGEFHLAENGSIRTQRCVPDLAARLRGILKGDDAPCLVGIPNIRSNTPKAAFWEKYKRCSALLRPSQSYVSSFVSRPDNAPWLDTPSYWQRIEQLWAGKDVTLVRGTDPGETGGVSLLAEDLTSARSVREVIGPAVNAWAEYPRLMEEIGPLKNEYYLKTHVVLLCLGPTATVMAADLCKRGVHAIDLGHVGMFRRWHLRGESLSQKRNKRPAA
jgi:hypothetical protein